MTRVRGVLTTLLLCGFATLGVLLLVLALLVIGLDAGLSSTLGAVTDTFGTLMLGTALAIAVPALVALRLRPRRPMAAGAVASMFGLTVFCMTASRAATDGVLLTVNLAGLALLLCALPVPPGRLEGERS